MKKKNIVKKESKRVNIVKLIVSLVICQLAGAIGALFTTPNIGLWYAGLVKPSFNPPNWIFGPVWTALFLMMGYALYLVWDKGWKTEGVKSAMLLFGAQLFLNVMWSVVFFGMHLPLAAFIVICALWLSILMTTIIFSRISKPAAYLMLPYLAWVTFASVLNLFLFRLN